MCEEETCNCSSCVAFEMAKYVKENLGWPSEFEKAGNAADKFLMTYRICLKLAQGAKLEDVKALKEIRPPSKKK